MNSKKLIKVAALLTLVVFMTSCNRGGTGCPYELDAGFALLEFFLR